MTIEPILILLAVVAMMAIACGLVVLQLQLRNHKMAIISLTTLAEKSQQKISHHNFMLHHLSTRLDKLTAPPPPEPPAPPQPYSRSP